MLQFISHLQAFAGPTVAIDGLSGGWALLSGCVAIVWIE